MNTWLLCLTTALLLSVFCAGLAIGAAIMAARIQRAADEDAAIRRLSQ